VPRRYKEVIFIIIHEKIIVCQTDEVCAYGNALQRDVEGLWNLKYKLIFTHMEMLGHCRQLADLMGNY